jgi:hypothetical protein
VGALSLHIAVLSGYNSRDGGLECLGKQSGGNRLKTQGDNAVKQSVKLARRHECRCRRQKAVEVGYRGAFSRRGFG